MPISGLYSNSTNEKHRSVNFYFIQQFFLLLLHLHPRARHCIFSIRSGLAPFYEDEDSDNVKCAELLPFKSLES